MLCLSLASSAGAVERNDPITPCAGEITAKRFAPFSSKAWHPSRWRRDRGRPKASTVERYRAKLDCAAGPGHREAMANRWSRDRTRFGRHRHRQLARHNVNRLWAGAIYPSSAWFALPTLPPYLLAAIAEAAGEFTGTNMPGWTMVQVSRGEGVLRPGSRSSDDGWGWLAITRPYGDHYGVPVMGGYEQMLNPVKNAYVAARMWGASAARFGPNGTWHGSRYVTHPDLHYTGRFDVRNVLGGLTFGQAIGLR